jgi:hypothetical protein
MVEAHVASAPRDVVIKRRMPLTVAARGRRSASPELALGCRAEEPMAQTAMVDTLREWCMEIRPGGWAGR